MACHCGPLTTDEEQRIRQQQEAILAAWLLRFDVRRARRPSGVGQCGTLRDDLPVVGDYVKGNHMDGLVLKIAAGPKGRNGSRVTLVWIDTGDTVIAVPIADVRSAPCDSK